jgi:hypothetical protein
MRSEFEKYVTVLDFTNGDVMTYPINVFDMESEELETTITNMGHNLSNCEWMVHDELPIIH